MSKTSFIERYEALADARDAALAASKAVVVSGDLEVIKLEEENLTMARADFKESLENEYVEVPGRDGQLLRSVEYKCLEKLAKNNGIELKKVLDGIAIKNRRVVTGHFSRLDLKDIDALRGLTALTNLDLGFNEIEDIAALRDLTALTKLNLSKNQIEDISPLSGLTSLTELYILKNEIKDISPLNALTALTGINLAENQIEDIKCFKWSFLFNLAKS